LKKENVLLKKTFKNEPKISVITYEGLTTELQE
jgi:hypothetical protein